MLFLDEGAEQVCDLGLVYKLLSCTRKKRFRWLPAAYQSNHNSLR